MKHGHPFGGHGPTLRVNRGSLYCLPPATLQCRVRPPHTFLIATSLTDSPAASSSLGSPSYRDGENTCRRTRPSASLWQGNHLSWPRASFGKAKPLADNGLRSCESSRGDIASCYDSTPAAPVRRIAGKPPLALGDPLLKPPEAHYLLTENGRLATMTTFALPLLKGAGTYHGLLAIIRCKRAEDVRLWRSS